MLRIAGIPRPGERLRLDDAWDMANMLAARSIPACREWCADPDDGPTFEGTFGPG